VGAFSACGSWPTDQLQGTKPVRLRVRPATEGTHPHHRSKKFLDELKAATVTEAPAPPFSAAGADAAA